MKNQDWKLKYDDLKIKFMDAVDLSFRLGMEQGLQQAQLQQAQQASAQAAQMGGQPGEDPNAQMESGQPQNDGSELDQHINTLESMLQKSDPTSPEALSLKKSLEGIKTFQVSLKQASDFKKSENAIKAIGKAMQPKFTLSKSATKNMSEPAKKALSMQEQIVADLMKSMDEESSKVTESITKTLGFEHLIKE